MAAVEVELARLKALWDSGHPDRRGIWRGYEDWILEEILEMSENATTVGHITQLTQLPYCPPTPIASNGKMAGVKFEGGAQRSEFQPPYYLLEDCFLMATANRMRKGELSHGRDNYKGGGPEFVLETYNHIMAHLLALREGDETDNHMEAICANAQILCYHYTHNPKNFARLHGKPNAAA